MSHTGLLKQYRNITVEPDPTKAQVDNIRVPDLATEGAQIAANTKFIAMPYKTSLSKGAVAVVQDTGKCNKLGIDDPLITGHHGTIQDLAFSPFLDNVLATASSDSTIKVWVIPHHGLDEYMIDGHQYANLCSHTKPVSLISWNPSANLTIASASQDSYIKVWDIKNEAATLNYCLNSHPYALEWNHDGELVAALSKDRKMHVYDPRSYKKAIVVSAGSQGQKLKWLGR